jgi:putative MATE family efflux protein
MPWSRHFFKTLFSVALPIIIQQIIMSSLNMIDIMMVGQLGDVSIASVGLANQVTFVMIVTMFGIASGAAVFTAQYWGQQDIVNIRRVLGICVSLALLVSGIAGGLALLIPERLLSIYTDDPAVISLGSSYLRILGPAYLFQGITICYSFVLRSTGHVRLPMIVSIGAVTINTSVNYLLIFGHLGAPALGVEGAAIATLTARVLECLTLLLVAYWRRTPVAATLRQLFDFDFAYFMRYLKTAMPVIANEIIWAFGMTAYNAVYARISTESIAAFNIAMTIERLTLVVLLGTAHGTAIVVGNYIGASENEEAIKFARGAILLGLISSLLLGLIMVVLANPVMTIYQISAATRGFARTLIQISGLVLFIKSGNIVLMIGVIRSGGDTRFGMLVEILTIWAIGVPLALLGAFVFRWPVYWVYLLVQAEELIKLAIGMARFISGRWIHNLAAPPRKRKLTAQILH